MEIKQIKSTLSKCGIKKGDTLIIHGDAGATYQIKSKSKDKINLFFDVLIKYLGKQGNILIQLLLIQYVNQKNLILKIVFQKLVYLVKLLERESS